MLTLSDIVVWRNLNGTITITSCLENKRICEISNHRVEWFSKDICSPEVIAYVEEEM